MIKTLALVLILLPSTVWARDAVPRASKPVAAPTTSERAKRLAWDPSWPRHRPWEYGLTAATFGMLAYVQFGTYTTFKPRWEGPILFDGPARDVLRLGGFQARSDADMASDVFWGLSWAVPLADALVITLALDRNYDVALQLMAINAQAFAIVAFASRAMHKTAKRARASHGPCKQDPSYSETCGGSPASFFSGHTALTATAAGLTCAHHQFLQLYGGGWADRAACAAVILTSATTGVLRLMADRHYISDVLVGGAFGFLVGYGLPRLLHYRLPPGARLLDARGPVRMISVIPVADRDMLGVTAWGVF